MTDLRDGIGEAVRWYQTSGWLPDYRLIREEDLRDVKFGLTFTERLSGRITLLNDAKGDPVADAQIALEITFPSLRRLFLDRRALLGGTLSSGSLFGEQPLTGTMEVSPAGVFTYQFGFEARDGGSYRFRGEKRLSLFRPLFDFGVIRGAVSNARGEEIAEVELEMGKGREPLKQLLAGIRLA